MVLLDGAMLWAIQIYDIAKCFVKTLISQIMWEITHFYAKVDLHPFKKSFVLSGSTYSAVKAVWFSQMNDFELLFRSYVIDIFEP